VADVYALADQYVERMAALDPVHATFIGIRGYDSELTDYSPSAAAARNELARATLSEISRQEPATEAQRLAADVMRERLQVEVDLHESGENLRELRIIGSPFGHIRQCFDLMPTASPEDWETIAARMDRVPAALASFGVALREGVSRGVVAARRQALACAEQGLTWSGQREAPAYFSALVARCDRRSASPKLVAQLEQAAARAGAAYGQAAHFLLTDYAAKATEKDAAGRERYELSARAFLGMELDLEETYRWGWDELHRIEARMTEVAQQILPGEPLAAVVRFLETDPSRALEGEDRLRAWLQELMDRTIAELSGKHFDIPEPIKRVEAMIAPRGGAAAMYYTRPSEDLKRPGRTWYPTLGKTRFPLWGEVSTAYHEGVPGHHLQLAQFVYLAKTLSRFQRVAASVPGISEGWALYAERLMGELGYFDNPDYELGMLRAQAFRAMRVIVDIGGHLQLEIPKTERYHPGERWSPDLLLPFALEHGYEAEDFLRSEIDRYLGWPGQAICYKVGERVWLEIRERTRSALGPKFDLKAFHARALNLGPMGLAQLQREMAN